MTKTWETDSFVPGNKEEAEARQHVGKQEAGPGLLAERSQEVEERHLLREGFFAEQDSNPGLQEWGGEGDHLFPR